MFVQAICWCVQIYSLLGRVKQVMVGGHVSVRRTVLPGCRVRHIVCHMGLINWVV